MVRTNKKVDPPAAPTEELAQPLLVQDEQDTEDDIEGVAVTPQSR
jgi:hypothetical protein